MQFSNQIGVAENRLLNDIWQLNKLAKGLLITEQHFKQTESVSLSVSVSKLFAFNCPVE